jgi:hypothetical protein
VLWGIALLLLCAPLGEAGILKCQDPSTGRIVAYSDAACPKGTRVSVIHNAKTKKSTPAAEASTDESAASDTSETPPESRIGKDTEAIAKMVQQARQQCEAATPAFFTKSKPGISATFQVKAISNQSTNPRGAVSVSYVIDALHNAKDDPDTKMRTELRCIATAGNQPGQWNIRFILGPSQPQTPAEAGP